MTQPSSPVNVMQAIMAKPPTPIQHIFLRTLAATPGVPVSSDTIEALLPVVPGKNPSSTLGGSHSSLEQWVGRHFGTSCPWTCTPGANSVPATYMMSPAVAAVVFPPTAP